MGPCMTETARVDTVDTIPKRDRRASKARGKGCLDKEEDPAASMDKVHELTRVHSVNHRRGVKVGELPPILILYRNNGGWPMICITSGPRKDGPWLAGPDGKEPIVYLSRYIMVAVTSKIGGMTNDA